MSIKKYEAFLKVIETGALSKAADELGCTQSGVTHMIKNLESELGVLLMVRNKGGVKLTEQGRILMPYVMRIIECNRELNKAAALLKGEQPSVIRIGTFKSMAVNWLPKIIKEYQKEHSAVEFQLIEGDYDDIDKWIKSKEIDICFINMSMKPDCRCISLCEDRLLAVLPADHYMTSSSSFPVSEFEKEPVISLIDNTDQDARNVLLQAGINPKSKLKTKDEFAMLAMVENGLGICIMPELLLIGHTDNVKVMELEPPAKRTIGLAILSEETDINKSEEFVEFIVKWVNGNYRKMKL